MVVFSARAVPWSSRSNARARPPPPQPRSWPSARWPGSLPFSSPPSPQIARTAVIAAPRSPSRSWAGCARGASSLHDWPTARSASARVGAHSATTTESGELLVHASMHHSAGGPRPYATTTADAHGEPAGRAAEVVDHRLAGAELLGDPDGVFVVVVALHDCRCPSGHGHTRERSRRIELQARETGTRQCVADHRARRKPRGGRTLEPERSVPGHPPICPGQGAPPRFAGVSSIG